MFSVKGELEVKIVIVLDLIELRIIPIVPISFARGYEEQVKADTIGAGYGRGFDQVRDFVPLWGEIFKNFPGYCNLAQSGTF